MSVADEVKKLMELRDAGALTEAEFQQQKERLLAGRVPEPIKAAQKEKSQTPYLVAVLLVLVLGGGFLAFKTWNTGNWEKTASLTSDASLLSEIRQSAEAKEAPLFCLYKGAIAYRYAEARDAGISQLVAKAYTTESALVADPAAPNAETAKGMASEVYAESVPPALIRERYVQRC
nr:SHOCT domain-containing protein [Pseudomonas sp.]